MSSFLLKPGETNGAVPALKDWLVRLGAADHALPAGEAYDTATVEAVKRFQAARGGTPDGVVGPGTWALLAAALQYPRAEVLQRDGMPQWVRSLVGNDPRTTPPRPIDTDVAVPLYGQLFKSPLDGKRLDGFVRLLKAIEGDPAIQDLRWAAYMLATVRHECDDAWQPIEEHSRGVGKEYGKPVTFKDSAGVSHANVYYGRGYVQLTWDFNYRGMGKALGLGEQLSIHPELALDHDIAYRIMSHGMRNASFCGNDKAGKPRSLPRFISGESCDYVEARRIINGQDQAQDIAIYATRFQTLLCASVSLAAGAQLPAGGVAATHQ